MYPDKQLVGLCLVAGAVGLLYLTLGPHRADSAHSFIFLTRHFWRICFSVLWFLSLCMRMCVCLSACLPDCLPYCSRLPVFSLRFVIPLFLSPLPSPPRMHSCHLLLSSPPFYHSLCIHLSSLPCLRF